MLGGLRLEIDLWKCQNVSFFSVRDRFREMKDGADKGEPEAGQCVETAVSLAGRLGIRIG